MTQAIPTLVLPDGTKIVESIAIIEYLNEVHPEPNNLFPGGPLLRAKIRGFAEVVNSGIHPLQNLKLLEKVEKDYGANRKEFAIFWIAPGLATLESMIEDSCKGTTFIFGNQITGAELCFFPQIYNAKNRYEMDLSIYPNINRIYSNMEKVKEVQDALPENQKGYE